MTEAEAIKTLEDLQRLLTNYRHISTELTEANGMAINALEKQIAKKPTEVDERMPEDYAEYYYLAFMCPSCGGSVTGQPYRPNHCKHCGQKLDWSEV